MNKVFVAAGMVDPKNSIMQNDAIELGRFLAKNNCTLVQGGSGKGMMGFTLNEFQKHSDKVLMIVPEKWKNDLSGLKYKKAYIVENEAERLMQTINMCDTLVILPGGTGTIEEMLFYHETKRAAEHNADIYIVNSCGYYNNFLSQLETNVEYGFTKREKIELKVFSSTSDLIKNLEVRKNIIQ